MTKTLALLLDSYRELNAKRLFWIVLLLSGLVVGAFAMVGADGDTITILWWKTPLELSALNFVSTARLYITLFTVFGVGFWLTWLANILALVSTAGIFPDFMAEGAIDLYFSKPLARFRLFATKYIGGLLFVTAQVTIFSFCSFLLLGFRGKLWAPSVFAAIPIVVLVFSYLFSICVLIGVVTRSTIAALLLTLLCWFAIWGVQTTETVLLRFSIKAHYQALSLDQQIEQTKLEIQNFPTSRPATRSAAESDSFRSMIPFGLFSGRQSRTDLKAKLEDLQSQRQQMSGTIHTAETIALVVMTVLPKTQATTDLLDRALASNAEFKDSDTSTPPPDFSETNRPHNRGQDRREEEYLAREVKKVQEKRSVSWVVSTSILFEIAIVSLAGWIFCRRDY